MALTDKLTAIGNSIRSKTGGTALIPLADMPASILGINAFEPDIEFGAVNSTAQAYLTASEIYDTAGYTGSVAGDYSSTTSRHDLPESRAITVPAAASKFSIVDPQSGAVSTRNVTGGGTVTVKNLIPNRWYRYFFEDSSSSLISAGSIKASGSLRMIDGSSTAGIGTFNIRDIGGRACDGGTLAYGKIFRGSQLNSIYVQTVPDAEQKDLFKRFLGIRDDIDLRNSTETSGQDRIPGTDDDFTSSPLGNDVDYVNIRISPYSAGVKLSDSTQTALYKTLIKRIISDAVNGKPCYIHCAEGADRTGTIVALIEALCGVSLTDIERGYELTSLAQNRERLRTSANWTGLISYIYSLQGDSFRDRVLYYALQAGVAIEDINAMRHALIDGNPSDIVNPFANIYTISVTTSEHTSIDNSATTIDEGNSYTANVSAATDYTANVVVKMDGVDITSTVYSNGVISIASVTGDLVITVTEIYVGNLFDPSAATLNSRINSSGDAVNAAAGQLVTDFIPASGSDLIHLISDKTQNTNTYTGTIALYSSTKTYLLQYQKGNSKWTWDENKMEGTFDPSALQRTDIAYVRLCIAYTDISNIQVKKG